LTYGDAKGMTLYTYDKDTAAGASACTGDCTKDWKPFVAVASAQPFSPWSVVPLTDGAKQWALNGKRLYTSARDEIPGHFKGDGAENRAWHVAAFHPGEGIVLPTGMIRAMEVADANGEVLVDATDMTLYTFAGDANADASTGCATPPCANHWI